VATVNTMKKLTIEKRASIIRCLTEGTSISSTARICGVNKVTILRLLVDMGSLCADLHDELVQDVRAKRVQVDEAWSFVGCKERNRKAGKSGDGDCWTWVGIDADSKLIVSYLVGLRELSYARDFIDDIESRIRGRIQLTSDGLRMYVTAVLDAYGTDGIDFAQLIKMYGPSPDKDRAGAAKYSPAECVGCLVRPTLGEPDPRHISTSYSERMNLTTRMTCRRFTRLTNAFSKKWRNHEHAIALHYFVYNFCRKHMTLGVTPAMAAGLTDKVWTIEDLVGMLVEREKEMKCHGRINRGDKA
jgi:IS1 family transposase